MGRRRGRLSRVVVQKNLSNLKSSDFRKQNSKGTMVITDMSISVYLFMPVRHTPTLKNQIGVGWLIGWSVFG